MRTETINPGNYKRVTLTQINGRHMSERISEIPEGYVWKSTSKKVGPMIMNVYVRGGDPYIIETLMERGYLASKYPQA